MGVLKNYNSGGGRNHDYNNLHTRSFSCSEFSSSGSSTGCSIVELGVHGLCNRRIGFKKSTDSNAGFANDKEVDGVLTSFDIEDNRRDGGDEHGKISVCDKNSENKNCHLRNKKSM